MVRTPPFHGGNTGSNPVGDTNYFNNLSAYAAIRLRLFKRLHITCRVGASMVVSRPLQIILVLAAFGGLAFLFGWRKTGDDLSSSYVGCKVLAAGEAGHLYNRDPKMFDRVTDPVWVEIGRESKFTGILHPYVQTPLWGIALEPICTRTSYRTFQALFLIIEVFCFSALIWLAAVYWVPRLFHPGWIALICAVFYASDPVRYALILAQTHAIFVLLTVVALVCARRRPILAGALLAGAAAVKITPAYFVIYWLLTRRMKAAASFVGFSAAFVAATIAVGGWSIFSQYLHVLSGVSNILLVAYNNQSFPAWLMSHRYPANEMTSWNPHPLPAAIKVITSALALMSAVVGGWMDRDSEGRPPYGAIFTLIGVTIFTPIAWTHYFFILIVPVMMFLDQGVRRRSYALLALAVLICALNVVPHRTLQYRFRSRFYAGALSMLGLVLIRRRDDEVFAAKASLTDAPLDPSVARGGISG